MKRSSLIACLILLALLPVIAAPVSAEASTITSYSPVVGYKGTATTITITGTNFNTSSVTVLLMKSGEDNVTSATPSTLTDTQIVCKFSSSKLSAMDAGTWYLVVINQDNSEVKANVGFTLRAPMTLTSITPAKARTNNDSIDVTVVGTGLADVSGLQLYNKNYGNISASDVDPASTKVTGTFDLTDADVETYEVCVKDEYGTRECGLSFAVTSDAAGSIEISSSPSGASLYLDGTLKGTTPITINDLDVGTYRIILKKSGYADWTRAAKVTTGATTSYSANLDVITTAPTTEPTARPTTAPTTVRTTRKSTLTTPTPWPSATPTPASPVGTLAIVGALCLAFIVLRKH